MSRTVIALRGAANTGKTSTIRIVFETMRPHAANVRPGTSRGGREVSEAHFIYKGVKIGFASRGDNGTVLRPHLEALVRLECDIIVCACRTHGGTNDAVREMSAEGYEIKWIEKPGSSLNLSEQVNQRKAEEIIRAIEEAVTMVGV